MGEVKRTFNPEFINRVDEIIIFDALTDEDLVQITRLLVEQLNAQPARRRGSRSPCATRPWTGCCTKTLSDRSYGARPLRRAIQRHIEDALSRGLHPRADPQRSADRDRGAGRRPLVRQDERGGASLRMSRRRRDACLAAWPLLAALGGRPVPRPRRSGSRRRGARGGPREPVPADGDAALLRLDEGGRPLRRAAAARTDFRRLWDTGLPRRPHARGAGRPEGEDRDLRGTGAQAHPDRGLPREQGPHHHATSRTS